MDAPEVRLTFSEPEGREIFPAPRRIDVELLWWGLKKKEYVA